VEVSRQTSASGVYLARHGQTAYNAERRFQGHLPVGLDETGRAQAVELAERALSYGFRSLWSSPLLRALQTTEVLAERIGLTAQLDPRLMETDAGAWTDRTFAEVQAEDPERFAAFVGGDPDFCFPQGESFEAQSVRVAEALADVERGELPALVVCHGVVIRVALFRRAGRRVAMAERVPNAALVALDPLSLENPGSTDDTRPAS
jgi:probable phosphoglycerate mutase